MALLRKRSLDEMSLGELRRLVEVHEANIRRQSAILDSPHTSPRLRAACLAAIRRSEISAIEIRDHLGRDEWSLEIQVTEESGPNLETQDARQILALVERTLSMYRTMGAKGDVLYGEALSHALFTFRQQINRIGILGTLSGKVAKFKEHSMIEVFIFTRINEADIPGAFVEYVRWRFGLPTKPAVGWLKSVLNQALTRLPLEMRAKLRRDAIEMKLEWLPLIDSDSWRAPQDTRELILDGVAL